MAQAGREAFRQEGGRGLAICTWRQPCNLPIPVAEKKNWGNGRVTFIRSEVSPPPCPPQTHREDATREKAAGAGVSKAR